MVETYKYYTKYEARHLNYINVTQDNPCIEYMRRKIINTSSHTRVRLLYRDEVMRHIYFTDT